MLYTILFLSWTIVGVATGIFCTLWYDKKDFLVADIPKLFVAAALGYLMPIFLLIAIIMDMTYNDKVIIESPWKKHKP